MIEELGAKRFMEFSEGLSVYLTQNALKRVYVMLKISDNLIGNLIEGQVKRGVKPNAKLAELHQLNGEALAYAEPMYEAAKREVKAAELTAALKEAEAEMANGSKTPSEREDVKEGKTISESEVAK